MNNVCISGTLGKEIKLGTLENGIKVFNNTVCITDGENSFTWINIVAYDKLAEYIVGEFNADDYVEIQGKLKTRMWKDNGEKRYLTEVMIYKIEVIE